jgi:uncharacterized protein (DUF2235 family)
MRRLIICLDGTWNSAEQGKEPVGGPATPPLRMIYLPTNVLKIYRAVLPEAEDGTSQIAYYSEGVGSFVGDRSALGKLQVVADKVVGGAVGGGIESRIKAAYRFLVANHHLGDHIFVFGFSRGAAEAQALVRFIDWVGGLVGKQDEYWIPELFDGFRDTEAARGEVQKVIAEIKKRTNGHIDDPRAIGIEFLGVFDTVLSLGYRFLADRREQDVPTVGPKFAFYVGKTPPPIVKTVRQALAIDERRWDFRPQIWKSPALPRQDPAPADVPNQSLEQVWFPGVHSNVGGGYGNDGFANGALDWMVKQANKAGLEMDAGFLKHFRLDIAGKQVDSDQGFMHYYEVLRGKSGRGVRRLDAGAAAEVGLHESVGIRLLADSAYRPANLLSYLAEDTARVGKLPAAQQTSVLDIVKTFKANPPRNPPR